MREIEGPVPEHLASWWEPAMCCLHSAAWWHSHWQKTGIVDVQLSEAMPDGWKFWLQWQNVVAPDNLAEIRAVEDDAGDYMGYVRVVAQRRQGAKLDEIIQSVPTTYAAKPLLRSASRALRQRSR